MSRPASAEHGAVFDFASLTQELREEESYAREGHTARTLLRAPDLRIILVVVRAGGTISEHHAQVTATVQVLAGKLRLQLPDRTVQLEVGQLLALGPGLEHVRRQPLDERARGQLSAIAVPLEAELEKHLLLEESTIFPAIRDLLSNEVHRSIVEELRARRGSSARATANTEAKHE